MVPVKQRLTIFKDGIGDCFNACVSSILEIPLSDTYDILPGQEGIWFLKWKKWFKDKGYQLYCQSPLQPPLGYSIVSVETERIYPEWHVDRGRPISHACVALDGVICHDPFPFPTQSYTIKYYFEITPLQSDDVD